MAPQAGSCKKVRGFRRSRYHAHIDRGVGYELLASSTCHDYRLGLCRRTHGCFIALYLLAKAVDGIANMLKQDQSQNGKTGEDKAYNISIGRHPDGTRKGVFDKDLFRLLGRLVYGVTSRRNGSDRGRYHSWRYLGQRQLGPVLGLGPKRKRGSINLSLTNHHDSLKGQWIRQDAWFLCSGCLHQHRHRL